MKNKYIIKFFLIFFFILSNHIFLHANEEFSFDITEIEITNDGNFFKGLKRGKATTNNGQIIIIADNFEYNKITNILIGQGNVEIIDKIKNYSINSNHITYEKKKEKIFSKGRTNAFVKSKYKIVSSDVNLDLISNILVTKNKAIIIDDKFTQYETGDLYYSINENIFKGNNIVVLENTDKGINELNTYKFKNGIFDLKKRIFCK